jgi:hypothetical protein
MVRFRHVLLLLAFPVFVLGEDPYEQAPIHYSSTKPKDAVQLLERLLRNGKAEVDRSDAWSVLRGVLQHLNIPVESQVLVFSKTSKQNDRISPQTPRTIYFNDNAYVGYSVGGSIEVAAIDPLLGPVFYLLDPHADEKRPLHFERDQSCLSCHGGSFTREVPGVLVRSVFPAASGHPILSQGSTVVDTSTPFSDRWGGWYVTGKHGNSVHRGNVTAIEQPNDTCEMPVEQGANVTDLAGFFDVDAYPRRQSDIVALMVLEHQTATQNVLTRANHAALRAMHMQRSLQTELKEKVTDEPVGTARRIIDHSVEDVLDALLFQDEAALPDGGIEGDEAFQTAFAKGAPSSADGRTLKDFQLLTRLFKHRCSYMIHSLTFESLTPPLKQTVLRRLKEVLQGQEISGRYSYLSASERGHIERILKDTKVANW